MRRSLLISVVSVAFTLLLLEVGLRFYVHQFGTEDQKLLYVYSREQVNEIGSRFEGVAYLNYRLSDNREGHNAFGYRGDEITQPKPADTFRIVALGGSTTYGEFIGDFTQTYPAELQRILRQDHGLSQVEVINAGVPAYTSWESLVNLQFRVLDLDPDMLIIYHGVNDIAPRLTDPDWYDGLNAARGYWRYVDDRPLPPSALYRFVAVRLGWDLPIVPKVESQFVQPYGYATCGLAYRDAVAYCENYDMSASEVMAANPPIYYERNLRNMIVLARAYDIEVMLSTWAYSPLVFDFPGGDFLAEPYRQAAIAEHNAVVENLAVELAVPFYDLEANLPDDAEYWIDGQHVSPLGATRHAALFAAFIAENDLIPDP